jgi:exopolysaccharide biosynthesis polyprenyl glycosylphosphotransferase
MKHYIWSAIRQKQYFLAAGDVIGIFSSFALCIPPTSGHISLSLYGAIIFLTALFHLIIFYLYDLYDIYETHKPHQYTIMKPNIILMLIVALFDLLFILIIISFDNHNIKTSRLVLFVISNFMFIIAFRYILGEYITKIWKCLRLAIIVPEEIVEPLYSDLNNIPLLSLSTHILSSMNDSNKAKEFHQNACPQKVNRIADCLKRRDFDILAFYSSNGFLSNSEIEEILRLPADGKEVYDFFALYESLTGRVPLRMVDAQWLLKRSEFQNISTKTYGKIKRLFDVFVSAFALAFLTPLMVLIGVAVKNGSKGPMFFVQDRLGKNFKIFRCYKFRTMVDGAERKFGQVWASQDDPRVTSIGRFLRKSRLDELPQLWNVLIGDMTLVGPRPIRESYARELEEHIPFYRLRFCVKPGITGWAQVNYDYAGSMEGQFEKFQYDLFYIKNMSLALDLLTLFKTIKTVIRQRGT